MSDWQTIETAPRDGTAILASGLDHGKGPSRHYSVVEWMDFGCESGWYPDEDSEPHIYLTHWMPLPEPPGEPATTSTDDLIARLRRLSPSLDMLACEDVLQAADRLTALQDREKELEAALRRINVGDGWAAQIARAALAKGEKG